MTGAACPGDFLLECSDAGGTWWAVVPVGVALVWACVALWRALRGGRGG